MSIEGMSIFSYSYLLSLISLLRVTCKISESGNYVPAAMLKCSACTLLGTIANNMPGQRCYSASTGQFAGLHNPGLGTHWVSCLGH